MASAASSKDEYQQRLARLQETETLSIDEAVIVLFGWLPKPSEEPTTDITKPKERTQKVKTRIWHNVCGTSGQFMASGVWCDSEGCVHMSLREKVPDEKYRQFDDDGVVKLALVWYNFERQGGE